MRAALDHDHAEIDRGTLLERKRTVDMALAPVLLVIDAAAAVAAGQDDVDLLRALRVEWREGATTAAWDPPEAGGHARRSIGAWLDALAAPRHASPAPRRERLLRNIAIALTKA